MSIGIDDFVANFERGGYRPNLFKVSILSGYMANPQKSSYLCKASSLPPSNMGLADVSYMGRKIKVAGDKEFPSWTTDFYEDLDMLNRSSFEGWLSLISSHEGNIGFTRPQDYYADITLELLSHETGETIRTYTMVNAFPTEVGEIALAYDSNDTIGEFPVTWEYNYWIVDDGHVII